MTDYYKTLQLQKTATQDEIKKSYRRLAKKFHPDANPGNKKAEEVFKEINKAYEILSDERQKAEYDSKLTVGTAYEKDHGSKANGKSTATGKNRDLSPNDFANTGDIFEDFFGFNPRGNTNEFKNTNNKVKPMKTNEAFEAVFGKRKF